MSASLIIMEVDNIKEGNTQHFNPKNAKKVCMIIEYLGDWRDCHFFTSPTLAICKSALNRSASSIITETDNIKEVKIQLFNAQDA